MSDTQNNNAMRIRAQLNGDKATLRVLIPHEMETGQRKDGSGALVPSWFINEVRISWKGRELLNAEWGPSVSKNPFIQIVIRGAKAGDKVTVAWVDNRGNRRSEDALIGA